jgi:hypothetical protein
MRSIYLRPLATALPAAAFAWWLKRAAIAGQSLIEVLAAAAAIAAVYYSLAFFTTLDPVHRPVLLSRIRLRSRPAAGMQPARVVEPGTRPVVDSARPDRA